MAALIEAGSLATAIADAAFEAAGAEVPTAGADAAMALTLRVAEATRRSWHGADPGALPTDLRGLRGLLPDGLLRLGRAEGFAYYALYPEAYLEAARALPATTGVIGIRSIGTTLGAVVAAGAGAAAPVTVRPTGHPFRRTLSLSAEARLPAYGDEVAIVDEGPGLSGSSFGAVLDALEGRGVAETRITALPSHPGAPGPQADPRHRARWERLRRIPAPDARTLLVESGRLPAWAAERLGRAEAPLQDVSGGAWRALRWPDEAGWPPVHAGQERLKFLHRTRDATWLLKFVGLGLHGEAQAARAASLARAGFCPEVAGFLHGFVAERWHGDARPVAPGRLDRDGIVVPLSRYLGWRARHMPAGEEGGAGPKALWRMARHNAALAWGEEVAARLDRWERHLPGLARLSHPVWTDGRLHAWEWLEIPGGLLKSDAVDHAAAHDLIGCQDIAWDVAGAAVEFDLPSEQSEALRRGVSDVAGREVPGVLLDFLLPCYLAFQMGREAMAAEASDGAEAERCQAAAARYAHRLRRVLLA
ncbi:hypothetical protein ACE7GA_12090 [Roseomonas sp. CCTCC AB2023176]|uniref:hypothetical protein n=1 Tax=Roseomonas sp. CCTCC AB2023176 TaxID=3342640 RepID=UPI0035DF3280